MAKINNVLELNGTRYDARTGSMLGIVQPRPAHAGAKPAHALHQRGSGRVMDGVIRVNKASADAAKPLAAIPVKSAPTARSVQHVAHKPKPLVAHQPQHAKTLMRNVVNVPAVRPKPAMKAQTPTDISLAKVKPAVMAVKPKVSSDQIDSKRAVRALEIPRSAKVARFQHNNQKLQPSLTYSVNSALGTVSSVPETQSQRATPPTQPKQDMFERAIANATSHEQPAPKESRSHATRRGVRRHVRMVSISAAVVAMLLLGGFVAYQNKVALQLQLASARAGFPASMPGYKPSGFAAKQLTYSPGTVTIGFLSGSNRSFNLTQKSSNWDSETLLQNYVSDSGQSYQAYQAAGRTVYIYSNGNATWVSGGVWYQVNGDAHLNNNQVIDLASSI